MTNFRIELFRNSFLDKYSMSCCVHNTVHSMCRPCFLCARSHSTGNKTNNLIL